MQPFSPEGWPVSACSVGAGMIEAPVAVLGILIILGAMEPFAALRRGAMELGRTVLAARRVGAAAEEPAKAACLPLPVPGQAVVLENVSVRHEGARGEQH